MSTRLPKQLSTTRLTTAFVDQYVAPVNTRTTISAAAVTNFDLTNSHYVTVTVATSTGSARNAAFQQVIPTGRTVILYGLVGQSLDPGSKVTALAAASSAIDFLMSGYETVP